MPAVSECFSSIKGIAMRATRLDATGTHVSSATGSVVSCGFTKLAFKADIEDGTEFVVKTAGGILCINQKDQPSLKRLTLTAEFCQVDPQMYEMITGSRLITDLAGNSIGYAIGDLPASNNFALEVWSQVAGAAPGGYRWLYLLLPWMVNPMVSDFDIANAPLDFKLMANTQSASPWGLGPYAGLIPTGQGILPHEHFYHALTSIPPPTCTCGYVAA